MAVTIQDGSAATGGSVPSSSAAAGVYCSASDLRDRQAEATLTQLADLNGDGVADADVLSRACAEASRQIDGYIGGRYATPVSPVPDLLRDMAARWAVYLLRFDRDSVTEDVRKAHDEDVAFLKLVGKGGASLGDEDVTDGEPATGIEFDGDTRQFTRTKLRKW